MKTTTTILALILSLHTFANSKRAGGPVKQVLQCKAIKAPKNLSVKLELIRAAVSPQYNIRGATLVKTKFDPANGNPQTKAVLTEKEQTAYNATFVTSGTVVEIDKSPLSATVKMGIIEFACK